jgi:phosphoglycerate dehydrogenase-like enzyme
MSPHSTHSLMLAEPLSATRPRVRFARPYYAPGLEWSADQPLLPDWDIVVGDLTAPGRLDGVDVLVAAAVGADLIEGGAFGLIQQIGTGTDRIDVEAATQAGVWVSSLPSGLTGNADGVADTAVLLTLAALRGLDESREALADGRWAEPAGRTHHPRVLALPHVAGVTEDMFHRAGPELAGELERGRSGRPPLYALNRPPSPRGPYSRSIDESHHVA